MISRTQELCRKLQPILGRRIDGLWAAYLAESDAAGKADIEQTLELLAARHLGQGFMPDRSPFPPAPKEFAERGDIVLGKVAYGGQELYRFYLRSSRLKEHLLVAGRSGSGKTNLTFMLMLGIMDRGIKVLALDWKRGYRDLLSLRSDLRVHTIGRDVSPFRFNPLIPPPGCEPHVWIKLIVDVIASSYLGGEGVISLLVAGMDKLYRDCGVFDRFPTRWPTVQDLLVWLKTVKLKGRAAMWQASAERILLAMSYGEFASVVNTQDNSHVLDLLDHNVVLEMDGLSSSSDRVMFSESLTLYIYRYLMARGPQERLTNVIVLEEAHNLLLAKQAGSKESVLESSIRMIRQYGLGYVFVDQSASLLSKVAFANSYATLAMSQKLRADVQTMAGAMNLTEEQRDALSTLPIGTAVVRLADEYPEPFAVRIPRCPIREGSVSDDAIRSRMAGCYTHPASNNLPPLAMQAVPAIPRPDNNRSTKNISRPPSPMESPISSDSPSRPCDSGTIPPRTSLSRDAIRFLADVAARPLSTTVSRYQRLNLSRRRGNAFRQSYATAGVIEAITLATRSGQVVLYELTDHGRILCSAAGIEAGPRPRESLEHRFWVSQAASHFEKKGYEVTREHAIKGNGAVDLLAERSGHRVAIEVETGKSDIRANLAKMKEGCFDEVILLATSPEAITLCQRAIANRKDCGSEVVHLMTWLDIS